MTELTGLPLGMDLVPHPLGYPTSVIASLLSYSDPLQTEVLISSRGALHRTRLSYTRPIPCQFTSAALQPFSPLYSSPPNPSPPFVTGVTEASLSITY
jgi:hypothetical protein